MVRIKFIILFLLLVLPFFLEAQSNRYIVYLKDKSGTPFSITNPSQFLSQRAIQRRANQKITITEEDLPVNPTYVTQLKATGANVFFTSKWLNCVLVETTPAILSTVIAQSYVIRTELVAPGKKLTSGRIKKFNRIKRTSSSLATDFQLNMIGIDSMHRDGYKGEGISLAVFDSGFDGVNTALPFKSIFQEGRLNYSVDFIANTKNVFQYDSHGTEVFSVIAADSPGSFTGGAYKATFSLFVTEDVASEYRIEEYNWLFAAEKADSIGVDVINSSLGYNEFDDTSMNYKASDLNGNTAIISIAAKKTIQKGMMVVCSAGNEGTNSWKFVAPPADVDGVLAIGSVTATKTRSSFSSFGPTADGRIKPDVMAFGSGVSVINPNGTLGTASGTSLSSPLVASLVAGTWQRYPNLKATELYQAIINSGDQFAKPDNSKGYGIPNYLAVKGFLDPVKIPVKDDQATINLDEQLVVYPNPTNDTINFSLSLSLSQEQSVDISIYDLQGKLLIHKNLKFQVQNNSQSIDLTSISAGLYIIKAKVKDSLKVIRLIKL